MKKKKIPLRKCLGCGANKTKRELIRVVKTPDDKILIDSLGKINGRGAYICNSKYCFNKAIAANKISRSLEVKIPKDMIVELESKIEND